MKSFPPISRSSPWRKNIKVMVESQYICSSNKKNNNNLITTTNHPYMVFNKVVSLLAVGLVVVGSLENSWFVVAT